MTGPTLTPGGPQAIRPLCPRRTASGQLVSEPLGSRERASRRRWRSSGMLGKSPDLNFIWLTFFPEFQPLTYPFLLLIGKVSLRGDVKMSVPNLGLLRSPAIWIKCPQRFNPVSPYRFWWWQSAGTWAFSRFPEEWRLLNRANGVCAGRTRNRWYC